MFCTYAILISSLSLIHLSTARIHGVDQSTYCETCLETAKEIKSLMETASSESNFIEHVLSGAICQKYHKKDKRTSCNDLFENNYDKLRAEMLRGNAEQLEMRLCFEISLACVGIKRPQTGAKQTFEDDDIRALLHANKDRLRIAKPLADISHKDEL